LEVIGFYHSHPDHPAIPSQYDLDHAWPVYSYIIVSVKAGDSQDLRSWEMEPNRSRFTEERVFNDTTVSEKSARAVDEAV
jgi:proteasome lid subunit RPN8/RPN11